MLKLLNTQCDVYAKAFSYLFVLFCWICTKQYVIQINNYFNLEVQILLKKRHYQMQKKKNNKANHHFSLMPFLINS